VRGGARNLRENNFRVTHTKYYEIHAINSDKAIGLYTSYSTENKNKNTSRNKSTQMSK